MNGYQKITEKIIEQLVAGVIPWSKPWATVAGQAVKHSDGTQYSILNQMLLGCVPGEYITYNQAEKEGGHIRKGAKAKTVYFWGKGTEKITKEDGTVEEKEYWFPKVYQVFHISDTEGVKSKWSEPLPREHAESDRTAEMFLGDYMDFNPGFKLRKGDGAYYDDNNDTVVVPDIIQFRSKETYYKTLFHQVAHSTGTTERLNRSADAIAFKTDHTSREDLLAEICSAMVCSFAGLDNDKTIEDTAAYINKWIPALKKDPQMIVWAASRAETAARYIMENTRPE